MNNSSLREEPLQIDNQSRKQWAEVQLSSSHIVVCILCPALF